MAYKDFLSMGGLFAKRSPREHITPHKLSVVILIQEYCLLRTKAIHQVNMRTQVLDFDEPEIKLPEPQHRIDFCLLILKLIQCPDMTYDEIEKLLDSGQYMLTPLHIENYRKSVDNLIRKDVGGIMDIIANLGKLLTEPVIIVPLVNRSSPIGVYLRRVMLFFDKLTFAQTVSIYRAFQHYVKSGLKRAPRNIMPPSPLKSAEIEIEEVSFDMETSVAEYALIEQEEPIRNVFTSVETDTDVEGEVASLWSRRQAELFIARQATLLQNNECAALEPPVLQEKIRQLLKANPEHSDSHFLSFLNCLRVKEFSGALESLYHYFDRSALVSTNEEKSRGFRYAALCLAALHAKFDNKKEALSALKEAVTLAHEVNDNVCLQHTQAWLYRLTEENKEILMERSISKCSDLGLNYLTSLGLQCFAQYAGTTGGKPALVFEILMRSDVLNCQFSMMDLMASSFAHKSALWTLYGKTEMASLCSQLLLHLDTADHSQGLTAYNGETTCQAICNVANRLTDMGEYNLSYVVLEHAKSRFPNSQWWLLSEQILYFMQSLYQGQWHAADLAVKQLATLDKWESLLRHGELLLANGNSKGAMEAITPVLDAGPGLLPSVRVRGLLIAAQVSQSVSVSILTAALSIANYHYLDYLTALVSMHLANLQLQLGLPSQALKSVDQSLLAILSHGGYYDQGTALVLFVKCKMASRISAPEKIKSELYIEALKFLEKAKINFNQVKAFFKVKETVHIQALLNHALGNFAERNKCALEFRLLDEQFPTIS